MDQLTDMGFSRELAAEALAATGGKSTLKATEWILNQRKVDQGQLAGRQQARVDHFFTASSSRVQEAIEIETDQAKKIVRNVKEVGEPSTFDSRTTLTIGEAPEIFEALPKQQQNQQNPQPQNQPQAQRGELPPPKKQKQEPQEPGKSFPPVPQKNIPKTGKSMVPLAERMRPGTIDDIVGQDHLLGVKGILRSLMENDLLPSVILWGPPGTGKTTLARAIASTVSYRFVPLSAVTSGVKEVREVLEEGKRSKKYGQRTLLFVDEVHRFNKAQQDAFLPYVEAGHVVFIGATTENPSFEINAALLSRCKVLTLNKLQPEHIQKLLDRAIWDKDKGVIVSAGIPSTELLRVENGVVQFLAGAADGDARVALNTLEISVLAATSRDQKNVEKDAAAENPGGAKPGTISRRDSFNILEVLKENVQHSQEEYTRPFKKFVGGKNVTRTLEDAGSTPGKEQVDNRKRVEDNLDHHENLDKSGVILVTLADAREALQRSHLHYDKTGEEHYNIISALHKSMRGGDADASIYWLARMLEGGEGPLYIARRLVRFASEDVGLADPQALQQAVACYQACHFLGMPECNVHLAQCVVYLAFAPKSVVVYQAIGAAQRLIKEKQNEPVPLHLRNAPTGLMKELGYGKGYIYPPSQTGPVEQEYMPPSLRGYKFLKWPETPPTNR